MFFPELWSSKKKKKRKYQEKKILSWKCVEKTFFKNLLAKRFFFNIKCFYKSENNILGDVF